MNAKTISSLVNQYTLLYNLYMSLSNLKLVNYELLWFITTIADMQKKQDIITSLTTYHAREHSTVRSIVLLRNVLYRDRAITSRMLSNNST